MFRAWEPENLDDLSQFHIYLFFIIIAYFLLVFFPIGVTNKTILLEDYILTCFSSHKYTKENYLDQTPKMDH